MATLVPIGMDLIPIAGEGWAGWKPSVHWKMDTVLASPATTDILS